MQTISQIKQQAIKAAKQKDWKSAVELNKTILSQRSDDVPAHNRLGVALLQLGKTAQAKKIFTTVISLDKTNIIAQKQLEKIKNNRAIGDTLQFSGQSFIEEPGKTRSIELHRLANKDTLEALSAGMQCDMKLKNRYISVSHENNYVGALPEDVSFRLSKLLSTGNTYSCQIQSVSGKHCRVFVAETYSSPENEHITSFPTNKANAQNSGDDAILFDENIPIQIVSTDADVERTLDDVKPDELDS